MLDTTQVIVQINWLICEVHAFAIAYVLLTQSTFLAISILKLYFILYDIMVFTTLRLRMIREKSLRILIQLVC
jgi:hypothetical protein